MTEKPITYGALRELLAKAGNPWAVDPSRADDELLPVYPTGGDGTDPPANMLVADEAGVLRILRSAPAPAFPELLAVWRAAGFPVHDGSALSHGDSAPTTGG